MREEVLRMERVLCVEQDMIQLEEFNLSIFAGEIMGLLPVNNHGLTALVRLLQHNTPLQGGYVYYREEQINTWRKARPGGNRIGIIQSESSLVGGLTVADNIFVLRPGFRAWYMRPSLLRTQILPFLAEVGIEISADAYAEELTEFQRVVVEIIKAVVAGCKLIVLRDVGSYIGEAELGQIHQILRHYADQGHAFLYIDFHFEELCQVCHRVALFNNGRVVKVLQTGDGAVDSRPDPPETLKSYTRAYDKMVHQDRVGEQPAAEPVFTAEAICGDTLRDLSFSVAAGECLVLQDVDNRVLGELLDMLTGDRPPRSGRLLLEGREINHCNGGETAIVQELPTETMLFPEMSYMDNLCFTLDHRLPELWRSSAVRRGIRMEYGSVGPDLFRRRVDSLSEIEKYELVYNRILLQRPKVVFCVQPFRRADMELRMRIWALLKMLLDKGIAVVILAVNLADALSLAHQLIRIKRGAVNEHYTRAEFSTMPVTAPWLGLHGDT